MSSIWQPLKQCISLFPSNRRRERRSGYDPRDDAMRSGSEPSTDRDRRAGRGAARRAPSWSSGRLAPLPRGQAQTNSRLEVSLPDANQPADLHGGKASLTNPLPNPVLRALEDLGRAAGAQQFSHIQSPSGFASLLLSKPWAGWSKLPGRFGGGLGGLEESARSRGFSRPASSLPPNHAPRA